MKHACRRATCSEVKILALYHQRRIAGGESAFAGQRRGHILARHFLPMLSIFGSHYKKLTVYRIAKSETVHLVTASNGIKKKCFSWIGVLLSPGLAAIRSFVDTGIVSFAAGHHVRNVFVERL